MSVPVVTSPLLDGVRHGFLGRQGGVSTGLVAGLNVGIGSGDDPAAIASNRRRAVTAVAPEATLTTVFQVHSPDVVTATEAWSDDARPHADALVTDRPGLALGILTADCAPVLFVDTQAGVIGAAHAGWKGAIGGVTDATIAAMEALGARRDRIVAVVGPCIAQASYEVDEGFCARFAAADAANERFFVAGRAGHARFDLPGYVVHRLHAAGIAQAAWVDLDTLELADRFYSFRRATLAGEPDYGRQISLIALR
jgi:polyphenol oxidase